MAKHEIEIENQPMADQIMVKCACGWKKPLSHWDFVGAQSMTDQAKLEFRRHKESVERHAKELSLAKRYFEKPS